MTPRLLAPAAFVAVLLTSGCVGIDTLVFTTKTNLGLDLDSTPPTAQVAMSRKEGVLAPTFSQGETPPVLASFRAEGRGLFSGGLGSTFATGNAAIVLAALYVDPDFQAGIRQAQQGAPPAGGASGTGSLDANSYFDSALQVQMRDEDAEDLVDPTPRPVFFGTTTSLGLNVTWSGMTATLPDSVNFGYRRKELALAPVTAERVAAADGADGLSTYNVRTPSLLATVDSGGTIEGPQDTELVYLQYFATGEAATTLSLRHKVRRAMISRLDPNSDELGVRGAPMTRRGVYGLVFLELKNRVAKDPNDPASEHIEAMNGLTTLVPATWPATVYQWKPTPQILTVLHSKGDAITGRTDYNDVNRFWSELDDTVARLREALDAPNLKLAGPGVADSAATRVSDTTQLRSQLDEAEAALASFEEQLAQTGVLSRAFDFYSSVEY